MSMNTTSTTSAQTRFRIRKANERSGYALHDGEQFIFTCNRLPDALARAVSKGDEGDIIKVGTWLGPVTQKFVIADGKAVEVQS